ncbi:magnesium-translocating P-type ATPase [Neoroseomonas soli]|uniref:Magnesium-transporting ATPase, P-type 1 n=1 Tax=Neoroseomonas soli TaxID=1081025 RepID=A0A9X9WXV3_9PROT|nr:magnesium-translocating P-type ATPase [Neoroseomonas soli]MBR0671982.1 magnesium-translocating P-type ATPase [Neoroseomonas soli]
MPDPISADFWAVPTEDLLSQLSASREGLTQGEARQRLATAGRNAPGLPVGRRIAARIATRLMEPLVAILIVAAAVSGATGDWASFAIILCIVTASVTLDVTQEHRAETAAEALRRSVALRARVLRDGQPAEIPAEEVVPGDIVDLAAGDLVPADGIVLAARAAQVNEALLTGEPYPVEKRPGPNTAETLAEAASALFGGTSMVAGEARMLVVATGARARFGGIAAALRAEAPPSAFQRGLHDFGVLILRLTGFLVLFVLLTHLAFGRPALESFLFAVALAVGLTPELLPMVMTVTLSRGALRMAERRVVVKRLSAVHDLGAMDVLCTDKTGTLTEARIELVGHPGLDGTDDPHVRDLAAINAGLGTGVRGPLDAAIVAAAAPAPGWQHVADVPFTFDRRRNSVLAGQDGRRLLVVKGAAEEILPHCIAAGAPGTAAVPLDAGLRERLAALEEAKAAEGLRCLAIAWREMPPETDSASVEDETDLVFAGYCVFVDPPKAGAAEAVARLTRLGVRVKIVSGDAPAVVRHLVTTLGLKTRGMLTGVEIARLSDAALAAQVLHTDLFARVAPEQKTRIIRALKARGHRVGFLGDGINDAPAIHAADAGISVEGATDVAQAAADLILLDHDLGVLADGVEEGRRTHANIMKYVRMGTSSNFGNMLSMAAASLVIPFLPLTPIQVLLNNLLYDLSETGIPFDDVDAADTTRPHAWDMAGVVRFTLVLGPLSSLFDMATFAILIWGFAAPADEFRTAWFVESMATQILVIFLIRSAAPVWRTRPHAILAATSLGALVVALLLALTPAGAIFGFAPLSGPLLAAMAGLVVLYLVAAEVLKRFAMAPPHRRRRNHRRVSAS